MKNYILICFTILCILCFSLTNNKDVFVQKQIDYSGYANFASFNSLLYNEYEAARFNHNYTHLEALNYVNHPNYYKFYTFPHPAIFESPKILVNKCFYLTSNYIPNDLVDVSNHSINYVSRKTPTLLTKSALDAYINMENAAKNDGIELLLFSAYRSFSRQDELYYDINNCNDQTVARPGFSEHQTGLALDISTPHYGLTTLFENSSSFKWLINNCRKFGFILRYPKGKEHITGYNYEPWHFRYVGDIAIFIDSTLEEYYFSNYELPVFN